MPPPALPGKTLHQRTKSTPAFSTLLQAGAVKAANKKVLGEVNANSRILQSAKDDSEVGKASPGKISLQDTVKPVSSVTAPLAKAAARPLAPKPASAQNVLAAPVVTLHKATAQMATSEPEVVKKVVVAKKSMKVLKDVQVQPAVQPEPETNKIIIQPAPVQIIPAVSKLPVQIISQSQPVEKPLPNAPAVQHHEVHKTESVPLKDEPAARLPVKPAAVQLAAVQPTIIQPAVFQPNFTTAEHLPPGFTSQQEYMNYLDYYTAQYQAQQSVNSVVALNGSAQYAVDYQVPTPQEQFYDVEELDVEYEDGYTTAPSVGMQAESTGYVTTLFNPKYTDKVKNELQMAKEFVESTRPIEDIEDEAWDTSMVAEYGDEIFDYMRQLETRMAPNARYMEQQTEIQWSMRAVLMDWVVQVHQRFNLLPETLFLTANYIDRFLSCKIVSLGKLQLVGATAIFVAAKYEEVQCPTISEIVFMVDNGYTADELLKAERFMLSMLQFELGWPGPMSFLRRISKADDYDLETRTLAKYFLEVTIMDERFVGCTPSYLAAGAHCLARLMIYGADWSKAHVYYSNYTWTQLQDLLRLMLECCEDPFKHHQAVYEKYTDKRYKRSSLYVMGRIKAGYQLPRDNPPALPLTPPEFMPGMVAMLG